MKSRLLILLLALGGCSRCGTGREASWTPPTPTVPARASVWAVDDSERVGRRDGERAFMRGEGNAIWSPGQSAKLFAMPGETVALQIGITAGPMALANVAVELESLTGPSSKITNATGPPGGWQSIERFVVYDLEIARRSGGRNNGESLGWAPGAQPPDDGNRGLVPDPLIPVALAPKWADYPMTVAPGEHRLVWIDITLADDQTAGDYRGVVAITSGASSLDTIPIELTVAGPTLPYAAAKTMLFYDPDTLRSRIGSDLAERHYLQLMHRHHITAVNTYNSAKAVAAHATELSGALYTSAEGYAGPGVGRGADVIPLGTYGSLGKPAAGSMKAVEETIAALATGGWLGGDVFLYAVDEQCDSPLGPRWRAALDRSANAAVRALLVAHTCSEDPSSQAVDLAIIIGAMYDPRAAAKAKKTGKKVWVYNGALPQTGSFLTDGDPLSLRVNGWLQAIYRVERWFYWESVFWDDGNRGGQGPYDPWRTAETFHNGDGDHANGDGVLVYPGRQPGFPGGRSLDFEGVIASFRLKQWRRGIQDAAYIALARDIDSAAVDTITRALIPGGFATGRAAWPRDGSRYTEARRALFDIITGQSIR